MYRKIALIKTCFSNKQNKLPDYLKKETKRVGTFYVQHKTQTAKLSKVRDTYII